MVQVPATGNYTLRAMGASGGGANQLGGRGVVVQVSYVYSGRWHQYTIGMLAMLPVRSEIGSYPSEI